jgi:hypothetical protein
MYVYMHIKTNITYFEAMKEFLFFYFFLLSLQQTIGLQQCAYPWPKRREGKTKEKKIANCANVSHMPNNCSCNQSLADLLLTATNNQTKELFFFFG